MYFNNLTEFCYIIIVVLSIVKYKAAVAFCFNMDFYATSIGFIYNDTSQSVFFPIPQRVDNFKV